MTAQDTPDRTAPVRIAAFLTGDFPEGTAATSRIKCYAKALQDDGHEISLLFLWPHLVPDGPASPSPQRTWEGVPFHFFTGRSRQPRRLAGKIIDSMSAIVRSAVYFLRYHRRFDVVFLYGPPFYYFLPIVLLAAVVGMPVIIEQTELMSSWYAQRGRRRGLGYAVNAIEERVTHYLVDHCIVISHSLLDHYRHRYQSDRLHLIPIMVDPQRFKPGLRVPERQLVGYIGSFGTKDGVAGMIHAFADARKSLNGLRLRLMGLCESEEHVLECIRERHLEDAVQLTGFLRHHEVPDRLAECDLLVVNRIGSRYAQHGFPSKLGEYLAIGAPVIASKVSDVERYLRHDENALLIEPDSEDDLRNAIVKRYAQYERYTEVGLQGREVALKYFTHRQGAAELVRICRQAMMGAP